MNNDNKILIVEMGGLEPLIKQMLSANVEVQCNAVGCITNLATHDDNKVKIARSGALVPLTKLAKSKDERVQRNATGALLNMTHSDENRQELVNAGAIPVLVSLLQSEDADVQYYCTTALSNIAVDAMNRKVLTETEPKLISCLVQLMSTGKVKVQCQAALALRNLASDEKCQLEIVQAGGLPPLLRLLQSNVPQLILSSVACIRNISIHADNEAPIIDAGFLKPLVALLKQNGNSNANASTPVLSSATEEEIQCHAISTLRNLAASSERNKKAIVEAGAVDKCINLVLSAPSSVQSEMTACIAVLALSDELKTYLLSINIINILIPLTSSPNPEVQGNSGAAIGNLSSKVGDYSAFIKAWDAPDGGISGYLKRFLTSNDLIFEHIAAWTLLQFMEGGDKILISLIEKSSDIMVAVQSLSVREVSTEQPTNGDLIEMEDAEAESEIIALAVRVLKIIDENR